MSQLMLSDREHALLYPSVAEVEEWLKSPVTRKLFNRLRRLQPIFQSINVPENCIYLSGFRECRDQLEKLMLDADQPGALLAPIATKSDLPDTSYAPKEGEARE